MDNKDTRTIKQWATAAGINPDSVRKAVSRKTKRPYGITSVLTADEWEQWRPGKSRKPGQPDTRTAPVRVKKESASVFSKTPAVQNVAPSEKPQATKQAGKTRAWILYLLMLIPAAASIQNMHGVTFDITGHLVASILLTALFSASPFLFVLAGVKNAPTGFLVACMVVYEAFCNLTRIYGGLTGFGKGGFPTRFLGLVTDVFGTGTHETGVFLSAIMAILAACTFYAAYFELTKTGK
jgi:hypothetical protein